MISCKFVVDRLALYLAGEISPRWAAFIASHLLRCGHCREVAEEMREADGLVRDSMGVPISIPATLDARIADAIAALPPPDPRPMPRLPGWILPMIAPVAVALVGVGFVAGRLPKPESESSPPPIELPALQRAHVLSETSLAGESPKPGPRTNGLRPVPVDTTGPPMPDVSRKRYLWRGIVVSEFSFDEHIFDRPNLSRDVFNGPPIVIGERDGYSYAVWCEGETHFVLIARVDSRTMLALLARRLDR